MCAHGAVGAHRDTAEVDSAVLWARAPGGDRTPGWCGAEEGAARGCLVRAGPAYCHPQEWAEG